MKIDWKQKLSSRKFWAAVVGFVTPVMYLMNFAETQVESVTTIILAVASLITYVLAEGYVDAHRDE